MKCKKSLVFLFCIIITSGCSSNLKKTSATNEVENKPQSVELKSYDYEINRLSKKELFESRTIYFSFDKDEVSPDYDKLLSFHANYLIDDDIKVKLIAYTDKKGPELYNVGLRKRRAEAVKEHLIKVGVKEDNISIDYTKGKDFFMVGESDLVSAKSRKVVLVYGNKD